MKNITLNIGEHYAEVLVRGQTNERKIVRTGDLKHLFLSEAGFDTGILPVFGQNAMGIKQIITKGNVWTVVIDCVNIKRDINFGSLSLKSVPFPDMLFVLTVEVDSNSFKVIDERCYCHIEPIIKEETMLYLFPFGNIFSDQRICWGDYSKIGKVKNLNQLIGIPELFLSSGFNSHIYSALKTEAPIDASSVGNFFKTLEEYSKETSAGFPYHLVPLKENKEYGKIFK